MSHKTITSFQKILMAEQEEILKRRRLLSAQDPSDDTKDKKEGHIPFQGKRTSPEDKPLDDLVGLGLSGGGIRSATFNLGILQAMEKHKGLRSIDYMSTVSGGGYIGSCLTWFSQLDLGFPFGKKRSDYCKVLGGQVLNWLRVHGNYLTPGDHLSTWALVGALLGGIIVNLAILIPLFLVMVFFLSICIPIPILEILGGSFAQNGCFASNNIFIFLLCLGVALLIIFVLLVLATAILSRFAFFRKSYRQYKFNKAKGVIIAVGVLLIAIGSIPIVHALLLTYKAKLIEEIMSSLSISGIATIIGSLFKRKDGNEATGIRSIFLSVGLGLVIYGMFLWFYHLVSPPGFYVLITTIDWYYWAIGGSIWLFVIMFANINQISMHRFYRNRLMDAYMPHGLIDHIIQTGTKDEKSEILVSNKIRAAVEQDNVKATTREMSDSCKLKDLKVSTAPYHIINANLQTIDSKIPKLRQRCGENFIFSPLYSGSENTAWVKTSNYLGGEMKLATAMAISGAAVDTNTSLTRSRPLSFIMSLFNIKLGYWTANPVFYRSKSIRSSIMTWFSNTGFYFHLFADLLGWGLSEKSSSIHLSDGGHFENLGLYELIRRQCKTIIISDAGADPDRSFEDLAKAIEMIRVDFGVKIKNLDTARLNINIETGVSDSAWVKGTIHYPVGDTGSKTGTIYYIKPSMLKEMSQDIKSYHIANPTFPHQSTVDQFFDEKQFEAYREIGFTIGNDFFGDIMHDSIRRGKSIA